MQIIRTLSKTSPIFLITLVASLPSALADFSRHDKKGKAIQYVILKVDQEHADVRNLFLMATLNNFRRLSLGTFEPSMRALRPNLETVGDVMNLLKGEFEDEAALFHRGEMIWIGAYSRKVLVGWASFQKLPLPENGVFVTKLYVDPEFQNRGIGKTLLLSIKTDPQLLPETKKIYLTSHLAFRDSIRFYKRIGFVENTRHRARLPSLMNLEYTIP